MPAGVHNRYLFVSKVTKKAATCRDYSRPRLGRQALSFFSSPYLVFRLSLVALANIRASLLYSPQAFLVINEDATC